MRKFVKVSGIITTTILGLQNLFEIVPQESYLRTSLNSILMPMAPILNAVIVFLSLSVIATMIYDLVNEKKIHCFRVGNRRFCKFFSGWYSKDGLLSIFCDDLEGWITPRGNQSIYDALKEKSRKNQLHLFLGKESPQDIIEELRNLGAIIHQAPLAIISTYSFSCLSIMGNNSAVIIRNKQEDVSHKIKFVEVSNAYVTGLLNVLINEHEEMEKIK